MKIALVASEIAPPAKVGGLADVILGLGRALKREGKEVFALIPKYKGIDLDGVDDLKIHTKELSVNYGGVAYKNTLWEGGVRGLKVYFFEDRHPQAFFSRENFYGEEDDADRFAYFSKGVLAALKAIGTPDVIHLHDWQTALCAPLIKEASSPFKQSRIIFTIHNIAYQGNYDKAIGARAGLSDLSVLADPYSPDRINLMKGGILQADAVTTVSPTYAKEVMSSPGGRGLEEALSSVKERFYGILNGIDTDYWNPETDPLLPAPFSPLKKRGSQKFWKGKSACKKELQARFSLPISDAPIVASVGRLVAQKGLELIKHALFRTLEKGGRFVLLGSASEPAVQGEFLTLKAKFAGHPGVHLELGHSEELVHLIFSGSDYLIVPSLFEPCGLTQMIALTYGTLPIVRRTGGLADTIEDVDTSEKPAKERTGYTFDYPDFGGVDWALDRALNDYAKKPEKREGLILNGYKKDFSWEGPAKKYLEIYQR